eukprot:6973608-Prymnesium_polylepis.1
MGGSHAHPANPGHPPRYKDRPRRAAPTPRAHLPVELAAQLDPRHAALAPRVTLAVAAAAAAAAGAVALQTN